MMKLTLMTLAIAFMALIPFTPPTAQAMDEKMTDEASVTAIMFFADSCGACKILDPKLQKALKAINQDRLELVIFDFSNRETIETTKSLATTKGLENILQEYGAKTGFVVLVDEDREIVETITASQDKEEIAAKMAKAIAQAS